MIRLIVAELRKLNRPLVWGVTLALAVFCVLLAVGAASNTAADSGFHEQMPSCQQLDLPVGPACDQALQLQAARVADANVRQLASAQRVASQLSPLGAGAQAAGLLASMPGALAIALMAGGHVGGEWSGRTMKHLLTQQGDRTRVILAKATSLWIAGIGVMVASWLALAIAGPLITHVDRLPVNTMTAAQLIEWSGSQAARALLVLAFFTVLGLIAAVVTKNTIGTMTVTTAAVVVMLIASNLPSLGRLTPATWVQNWMGFAAGQRSISNLPSNFWSRFIDATGAGPSQLGGGLALVAAVAVGGVIASTVFRRSDVVG